MNAYAEVPVREDVPVFLTSADISRLFQHEVGWFDRTNVRKRLYAKGFPHPIEAGRWSPLAVMNWMEAAGLNTDNVPPGVERHRARRKRPSRPGYNRYSEA
jgi:hypothetical protein